MRKVIGIGETLLDIVFRDGRPVEAVAGGSTFNTIVSLARSGVRATFVSQVGDDRVGHEILRFLEDNGIDPSCVATDPRMRTPLSLAFLDEAGNADYTFYRQTPAGADDLCQLPEIEPDDIVILGSFYAVDAARRPQVEALLQRAREREAIVYYDINFRPAHRGDVVRITANLLDNFEAADVVRGSRDDFATLFGHEDSDRVYRDRVAFYCKHFVATAGADRVTAYGAGGLRREYDVPQVETVSTIGAGDNFNAGLLFAMIRDGIRRRDLERGLSEADWDSLIATATEFAAESCRDLHNYITKEFGQRQKGKLR